MVRVDKNKCRANLPSSIKSFSELIKSYMKFHNGFLDFFGTTPLIQHSCYKCILHSELELIYFYIE